MREKVHCFLFLRKEGIKEKKGTEQIPKEKNRENGQQVREINYVNVHTITKHFTQNQRLATRKMTILIMKTLGKFLQARGKDLGPQRWGSSVCNCKAWKVTFSTAVQPGSRPQQRGLG